MCVAIFVGGNSMTWFNTAVLVTCMRNFPKSRGTIVGFLKGFIGLSGAIFTQIFISLLSSDGVELLLFLAVGPTLICLLCMGFIRPVTPTVGESYSEIEEEHRQFHYIYIVCVALAVYLFAIVFIDELFPNPTVLIVAVFVMFAFLLSPIAVPLKILFEIVFPPKKQQKAPNSVDPDALLEASRIAMATKEKKAEFFLALGEGASKNKKGPRRGEDFDLKQAIVKADFWLLFLAFFCGVGTAVTANNNLSQLAEAQGYAGVSTFVLLVGIWGFLGRLGGGAVSEYFVKYVYTFFHTFIYLQFTYIFACTETHTHMYLHAYIHTYAQICIYKHTFFHISYPYMHTITHICTQLFLAMPTNCCFFFCQREGFFLFWSCLQVAPFGRNVCMIHNR
jgi:hypothetical protein